MTPHRRRRRASSFVAACALGASSLGLAACGSSGPAGPSASELASEALTNAKAAGWVHETELESSGKFSVRIDNEVGTDGARQSITGPSTDVTTVFVNGVLYVKGNAAGLNRYVAIPLARATLYVGRWIAIASTDSPYKQLTAASTLAGDFGQYQLTGTLAKKATTELDGVKVTPITGTLAGTIHATMYVTTSGTIYPVEITAQGYDSSIRWSQWGVTVDLTAPKTSVPLSAVDGE